VWNWPLLLVAGLIALFFGIGMTVTGHSIQVGLITFGAVLLGGSGYLFVQARRYREELRRIAAEDADDADATEPSSPSR